MAHFVAGGAMAFYKPPCEFIINHQRITATKIDLMACWLNTALMLYRSTLIYHSYINIFLHEPYSVLAKLRLLTLQSIFPTNQYFKHPLQNITFLLLKILFQVRLSAF